MANLKGIISSVVGGAANSRRRGTAGGTGATGATGGGLAGGGAGRGAGGGRRSQDEAIGRGVRSVLSRFRR